MDEIYNIDASFLHKDLVYKILNTEDRIKLERKLKEAEYYDAFLKGIAVVTIYTEIIEEYLHKNFIPSMEVKFFKNEPFKKGEIVWFENNFYFKGIIKALNKFHRGIKPSYSEFHISLERYPVTIKGRFNVEHVLGSSSVDRLSGQKNKFVFAYIEEVNSTNILLRPILIGDRILSKKTTREYEYSSVRLHIDDIEEFKNVNTATYDDASLDINRNATIPEKDVKKMVCRNTFRRKCS